MFLCQNLLGELHLCIACRIRFSVKHLYDYLTSLTNAYLPSLTIDGQGFLNVLDFSF